MCRRSPPQTGGSWWYKGNFLLDGHNNADFGRGTFSLQVYGGGRLRWLFGDGQLVPVQAWPADSTPSLLDGQWHRVILVRRYDNGGAVLEMYIDGDLIASNNTIQRDMREWWDTWDAFPSDQSGWFWGIEKQVVTGINQQYEDFKGWVDDRRFYARAKSAEEIRLQNADLVGVVRYGEGSGSIACDGITGECSQVSPGSWSAVDAPVSPAADGSPDPSPDPDPDSDDDNDDSGDTGDTGGTAGTVNVITFDDAFGAYPWADLSQWIRDPGAYGGNPGPTAYASNYSSFPQETASFSFTTPQILESIDIATLLSGEFVVTTDTEQARLTTSANVPATLTTGFSEPTSSVTISFVGPNFGIDNIVSVTPE